MASLEADVRRRRRKRRPTGGGGGGVVTELNYNREEGGQKYPGNEAVAAAVKAHGATLRKIDLL